MQPHNTWSASNVSVTGYGQSFGKDGYSWNCNVIKESDYKKMDNKSIPTGQYKFATYNQTDNKPIDFYKCTGRENFKIPKKMSVGITGGKFTQQVTSNGAKIYSGTIFDCVPGTQVGYPSSMTIDDGSGTGFASCKEIKMN